MSIYTVDPDNNKYPYTLLIDLEHNSRYGKLVTAKKGMKSDGATYALDLNSRSWWIHDQLCNTGLFDDGSLCSNLQASSIIYDILKDEGRWFRARSWFIATLLFGGGKARKNGMFNT